jgi:type IV pilus assembly protein PilF
MRMHCVNQQISMMSLPARIDARPAMSSAAHALVIVAMLLLAGCVTETTGFNADARPEQALKDYIDLATGYLEKKDLVNAKRHLNNASGFDPNNSEVFALWGLVYSSEGEPRLADESFQRSLRINPRNAQARNNYAAFLFAESRFDDAYEQLEQVVEDTTYVGRAQAFENLGLAALRLQRLDDAEYAFGRAVQLDDRQLRASLELANLLLQKQEVLQARQYYRNYLTLLQLYAIGQTPRGLWVGIQLENALGNDQNVRQLGTQLEASFSGSAEHRLYRQFLDTSDDD